MAGTRKAHINRRRKGKLAVLLPWFRRFGLVLGAGVFIAWVAAWFFWSEANVKTADWIEQKTLNLTASMGFTVDNIMVEGRIYSDPEVLKALINVQRGDPLFSFDPDEAKKLVERVGWVKTARVERRFPDTIYIDLTERKPLALWQKNKSLKLLDEEGAVIATRGMERFKDLVVVMGEDAPVHATDLIMNLRAEQGVYERTEIAKWIGGRRWDLTLKGNVAVKLPESDMGLALRRLALAHEEDNLLDKDIVSIDLREPDRIVVRPRSGAVQEYKAGLKTESNI